MVRTLWAVVGAVLVVLGLTVGLGAWHQARDYREATAALQAALRPDPEEYLRQVRPHLEQPQSDQQLLATGNSLCVELDRSDGDVRALAADIGAHGPTDPDELATYSHDMTYIADKSIKWLCPRWVDAYLEQFPTGSPTV
ncbi:hypothetical protein EKO23_17630 [Nocardioides guangzhouensis]|uniref:DUF732 domain-containing protein n=1 Tax=Nocardioides guangzhouensis TaxID=2497878 RepID=A0A4Q4Z8M7_9ACTN|nr:hypothetical protein [Nocardioides guangzhouensis]RYP83898.1 hypothetical protein EKO23_17630 [Nocardioides guangzhouensis]